MGGAVTEQREQVLVFIHIPKTAGTALNAVLNMNEPGNRTRRLANVFKGGGGLAKGPMEHLRMGKGRRHNRFSNPAAVRVVRGHVPLGIREYLPNYLPENRDLRYFSFLREPVDRTLSHYFRIRDKREGLESKPGKFGQSALPAEPTLDDMLAAGYMHDNLHTRMLSGDPEPFGEVTEEMLEQAKRNLSEGLVFFGLTERFDESLVLAQRRLGFRSIFSTPAGSVRRVNASRPRGDQVPKELVEAAERCNRHDIELYRFADELFDAYPERQELDFEVELAALRAAKADGEINLDLPAPEQFGGDEEAWRMVLEARATIVRQSVPPASIATLDEAQESELEDKTAEVEKLRKEVRRLRAEASGKRNRKQRTQNAGAGRGRLRAGKR